MNDGMLEYFASFQEHQEIRDAEIKHTSNTCHCGFIQESICPRWSLDSTNITDKVSECHVIPLDTIYVVLPFTIVLVQPHLLPLATSHLPLL